MGFLTNVTFEGKTYRSVRAFYRNYKPSFSYDVLVRRLNSGMSLEQAVVDTSKSFVYKGKTYKTLKSLCNAYSVSPTTYNDRRALGWSMSEALGVVKRNKRSAKPIKFKGKTYSNIGALCEEFGISRNMYQKRQGLGWSLQETLNVKKRRYVYNDICKGTIYKITHVPTKKVYIGLTTMNLKDRWSTHLHSAFKAGSQTKLHRAMRDDIILNFKLTRIYTSTSRKDLIDKEEYYIAKFDSVTNGLNTHKRGNEGNKGKTIRFKGVVYRSTRELCDTYNIDIARFRRHYKRTKSIKKALEYAQGLESQS